MAFTNTIDFRISTGDGMWMTIGTFTTDTTSGNIDTGLTQIEHFELQHKDSAVVDDAPTVNATITAAAPLDGSVVPVIVTSGEDGYWMAIGRY